MFCLVAVPASLVERVKTVPPAVASLPYRFAGDLPAFTCLCPDLFLLSAATVTPPRPGLPRHYPLYARSGRFGSRRPESRKASRALRNRWAVHPWFAPTSSLVPAAALMPLSRSDIRAAQTPLMLCRCVGDSGPLTGSR